MNRTIWLHHRKRSDRIAVMDCCQRCSVGAGVTVYPTGVFVHTAKSLRKGDWVEADEKGAKIEHIADDLCEDCWRETQIGRLAGV